MTSLGALARVGRGEYAECTLRGFPSACSSPSCRIKEKSSGCKLVFLWWWVQSEVSGVGQLKATPWFLMELPSRSPNCAPGAGKAPQPHSPGGRRVKAAPLALGCCCCSSPAPEAPGAGLQPRDARRPYQAISREVSVPHTWAHLGSQPGPSPAAPSGPICPPGQRGSHQRAPSKDTLMRKERINAVYMPGRWQTTTTVKIK